MRRRLGQRQGVLRAALAPLLAAGVLYALVALIDHPLMLIALLAADATVMLACSRTAGFSISASDRRKIVGNCLLYCAFAAGYVALVALLLAWPIRQLANGGSLSAALLLSVAFVVAIFSLFRIWPVFALPFIRADLPPHRDAATLAR